MRSFFKKDLLLFWRDRQELLTVLVLPMILVIVLNFAFSGVIGDDTLSELDLQIGIVNQDDASNTVEQLAAKLVAESSFDQDAAQKLAEEVSVLSAVQLLLAYFDSENLSDFVTVHSLQEAEAMEKATSGDLDSVLIIPNGFTIDSLYAAISEKPPASKLQFVMEKETNNNSILYSIIDGYMDHLNYQLVLQKAVGDTTIHVQLPTGGIERIGAGNSFTMTQYFAIVMGALFSLFLAATVATKSGVEIRQQVFNRIILTNSPPLQYLISKMLSTLCLVFLQIMFVLMTSHLILKLFADRSLSFWLGLIGIVLLISLAIAGLSAIFTTIMLRVTNIDAANGFYMLIIIVLGIIGGNFVPISFLPDWLRQIGEWTPNGLFLVMVTEWIQFEELSSLIVPAISLILFGLLCTLIGLIMYPKRGELK